MDLLINFLLSIAVLLLGGYAFRLFDHQQLIWGYWVTWAGLCCLTAIPFVIKTSAIHAQRAAQIETQAENAVSDGTRELADRLAEAARAEQIRTRGRPSVTGLEIEFPESVFDDFVLTLKVKNTGDTPLITKSGEPSFEVVMSTVKPVKGLETMSLRFSKPEKNRLPEIPRGETETISFYAENRRLAAAAQFADDDSIPLPNDLNITMTTVFEDVYGGEYTVAVKGHLSMRGVEEFIGKYPVEMIGLPEISYKDPEK